MSFGIICRRKGCMSYATVRFTWPGKDESYACDKHGRAAEVIANAIGCHLQIISLTDADHQGPVGMMSLKQQGKE